MRRGKEFSASDVVEIINRIAGVAESSAPRVESVQDAPDVFSSRSATAIRINRDGTNEELDRANADAAVVKVSDTTERLIRALTAGYFPRGLYFTGREHRRLLRRLVSLLRPGAAVLDLGCGPAMRYRPYFKSLEVEWFGADLFQIPDVENYGMVHNHVLPFTDQRFEAVTCFNVIEHFDEIESMFSEIARVTAKGGLFAGACAFHEKEHSSYFHLSHLGLETIAGRYGFKSQYLRPSEYTGAVLASQRHFGGPGRIISRPPRMLAVTVALSVANTIPFLITNALEFLRRLSPLYDPFDECATLYFVFRRESEPQRR
jgi:SAM-dependent methyltransferase